MALHNWISTPKAQTLLSETELPKPVQEFAGRLIGTFFMLIFTARFFIEFIKENQEAFEQGMLLNMGQILSIPCVLIGLFFLIRSYRISPQE